MSVQQQEHLMQLILTKHVLKKIIFNVEFDDTDNSDNNLKQFEEENIMQTIANIDNFNSNDLVAYNEAIIETSIQATIMFM
ncbi:hypothetical protein C2G38_2159322 [Gigaspora rosea]|uniref:Uncharacterized protein n=1 Tax=Gigaspora rosea TaxID=44941 RepID=A0A397W151_9GLOM|nr:hypothetical protein C2G38_2159322 [Gigaspora rosea]